MDHTPGAVARLQSLLGYKPRGISLVLGIGRLLALQPHSPTFIHGATLSVSLLFCRP